MSCSTTRAWTTTLIGHRRDGGVFGEITAEPGEGAGRRRPPAAAARGRRSARDRPRARRAPASARVSRRASRREGCGRPAPRPRPRRDRGRTGAARYSGPCRRRRRHRRHAPARRCSRRGSGSPRQRAEGGALVSVEAHERRLVGGAVDRAVGLVIHAAKCCSRAANDVEGQRRPAPLRFTYLTPASVLPFVRARYGAHARGCTSQSRQNAR